MVTVETLLTIQNICRLNPRVEMCGLVTSPSNEVIQIKNASKTPEHCFVFDKREYFKALNQMAASGSSIACIWHSHPEDNPEPSKADIDFVRLSKRNSLIVSATDHRWLEYAPS